MRATTLQVLTNEMYALYPGMTIYGKGDPAHAARVSDHNEDDTAGVRSAQSDPDTKPEHRAIDLMLGSRFTEAEAFRVINDIIARERALPANKRKLRYINFKTTQWHTRNNYAPMPNNDDPHPTHVHVDSEAAQDENTSQWISFSTGGIDVLKATRGMGQNGQPPHDNVLFAQRLMNFIVAGDPRLIEHPLAVDGNYGGNTAYWASVIVTGGDGNEINGDHFGTLVAMVGDRRSGDAIKFHADTPHGATEPFSFVIPAQEITVTPSED